MSIVSVAIGINKLAIASQTYNIMHVSISCYELILSHTAIAKLPLRSLWTHVIQFSCGADDHEMDIKEQSEVDSPCGYTVRLLKNRVKNTIA